MAKDLLEHTSFLSAIFSFSIFPLFLMYERECWSIHYFSVRVLIDRWRRWTILFSRPPFFYSSSHLLVSSLLPYPSSRSDHAVERFSLALRSHILKSFHFYFLCAFSPHICLQLVTILIIYVVSMYPWLNVCTLSLHDYFLLLSVCTLSWHESFSSRHIS
jgi:hypothetical protein